MRARRLRLLTFCCLVLPVCAAGAAQFSFAFITDPVRAAGDDSGLREAIAQTDTQNLAFVVVNGIKRSDEPCSDQLYAERRDVLEEAKNGIVVSLAGSDWIDCPDYTKAGALVRLNRLRELLFVDDFTAGRSRLPLVRQSATVKFRAYAENARWEIGQVMFATINLPADNNHFVTAAGRNSEFEDRQVANRDWLHRIFVTAANRKLKAVVLFCDGNPLAPPSGKVRDGYAEARRQLEQLTARFRHPVLLVHGNAYDAANGIRWHNGVGEVGVAPGWIRVSIDTSAPAMFAVESATGGSSGKSR